MLAARERVFVRAERELAPRHGGLVFRLLRHRLHHAVRAHALGQLVDHRARGGAGTRDELRADAVRIDRRGLQRGDRVFIEVVRHRDLRVDRAERVELVAHALGERGQVARVDAHAAELRASHFHRRSHGLLDVVRVDEQRGVLTERGDLRFERGAFAVVHQGEAVRGRADRGQAVQLRGEQVRRALESTDDRCARRRHGRPFVGAPAAHVHARAVLCGRRHARGRGGHRGIVVEDRQDQRFEQRALAERAFDLQDRRIGEVRLAFAVAADRAVEMVVLKPGDRLFVHDVAVGKEPQVRFARMERLELVEQAPDAGDHAVTAALGQVAREDLEHAVAVGGAVAQRGIEHRVLIHVGHHRRVDGAADRAGVAGCGHGWLLAGRRRMRGAVWFRSCFCSVALSVVFSSGNALWAGRNAVGACCGAAGARAHARLGPCVLLRESGAWRLWRCA